MAIVERYRSGLAAAVSAPDAGVYDAMNKGIALASGEVIGFLNADDLYADPTVLAAVAEALAPAEIDACYGDLVYVDRTDTDRVVRYWRSRPYQRGLFASGWVPAHPTFFVRRSVFERYGGFDLDYRFVADYELMLRLLEVRGVASVYIPRVLVRMRLGGMTNRSYWNILKGNLEAYRACRRHGIALTPLPILRKLVSRLPQFYARPNADVQAPVSGKR